MFLELTLRATLDWCSPGSVDQTQTVTVKEPRCVASPHATSAGSVTLMSNCPTSLALTVRGCVKRGLRGTIAGIGVAIEDEGRVCAVARTDNV